MTTVERLKIRCYKCNQLLAVPLTKAGAVVACPKCKADLLVPRPEAENQAGRGEDTETAANLTSVINLVGLGRIDDADLGGIAFVPGGDRGDHPAGSGLRSAPRTCESRLSSSTGCRTSRARPSAKNPRPP